MTDLPRLMCTNSTGTIAISRALQQRGALLPLKDLLLSVCCFPVCFQLPLYQTFSTASKASMTNLLEQPWVKDFPWSQEVCINRCSWVLLLTVPHHSGTHDALLSFRVVCIAYVTIHNGATGAYDPHWLVIVAMCGHVGVKADRKQSLCLRPQRSRAAYRKAESAAVRWCGCWQV